PRGLEQRHALGPGEQARQVRRVRLKIEVVPGADDGPVVDRSGIGVVDVRAGCRGADGAEQGDAAVAGQRGGIVLRQRLYGDIVVRGHNGPVVEEGGHGGRHLHRGPRALHAAEQVADRARRRRGGDLVPARRTGQGADGGQGGQQLAV